MRVRPEFGELVVEKEEPKPATVHVILPSRMADELADDWLRVDVARYVDASKPDVWQTKTVELKWPQTDPRASLVHFEPAAFDLRMKLKDTTEQKKFQSMQVGLLFVSPEVSNKYKVEYDSAEFRPDVTVAGPKQVIDNLSKDSVKPFALYVEVFSLGRGERRPADHPLGQDPGPRPQRPGGHAAAGRAVHPAGKKGRRIACLPLPFTALGVVASLAPPPLAPSMLHTV